MTTRRKFIIETIAVTTAAAAAIHPSGRKISKGLMSFEKTFGNSQNRNKPVVISTWDFGIRANAKAWETLSANGRALDAVEKGVSVIEADPTITTVGYGGFPDRDGYVTLDASIMDENGNAGAVAFLQHIMHPASVARMVMEKTPHVMIVGDGALKFALANGFKKMNLLTKTAKDAWKKWLKENNYNPVINRNNHDTIGMLALDNNGNLSGTCTTSGLAFKYHGRVADSAIIGAGLFVDNEVGAATSTGLGESVIKVAGSHLVVEQMRDGKSPKEACEIAVKRIAEKQKDYKTFQVAFIAINKMGEIGAYAIQKGFQYALYQNGENKLYHSDYLLKS
ncbi:MAG: N(4)-(beta-N-acetylglucosaminyl)-L-asparaginase [Bacteroidetes bacterium]|nr:N(4)-(beta-N-acetylglucosaminyl)-L-asparaginase [Bacteroidota bacterium]